MNPRLLEELLPSLTEGERSTLRTVASADELTDLFLAVRSRLPWSNFQKALLTTRFFALSDEDSTTGRVYFVEAGLGGPVKIGTTTGHVNERLRELQTGNAERLRLLGTVRGGVPTERRLHGWFRYARLRGEWFQPVPELREFIELQAVAA
jgi:hypothetical protein